MMKMLLILIVTRLIMVFIYIGSRAAIYDENASNFDNNTINNGLYIRSIYDECYNLKNRKFEIGINKSAVLTPSSTIDGGTY